jgi:DNA-binding MarR family transcriptional regulator
MSASDTGYTAALDQILELVVLIHEDMTQSLAKDGLSVSRATLLWTLGRTGPCPQRVLAEALGVSARNVTGLVDGLAAAGFVTREAHPTDRRATLVTLTAHGTEWLRRQERDQREFARRLFGAMPAARFAEFTAGLGDVLGALHGLGLAHRPAVTG